MVLADFMDGPTARISRSWRPTSTLPFCKRHGADLSPPRSPVPPALRAAMSPLPATRRKEAPDHSGPAPESHFARLNLMDSHYPVGDPMDVILPQRPDLFRKDTQAGSLRAFATIGPAGTLSLGIRNRSAVSMCRSFPCPTPCSERRADRMGRKIRVLIVDDPASVRQTMTAILSADPEIEVIAAASDPSPPPATSRTSCPMSSRWTSKCRAWTASPSCAS
jgi:hypothetical protein